MDYGYKYRNFYENFVFIKFYHFHSICGQFFHTREKNIEDKKNSLVNQLDKMFNLKGCWMKRVDYHSYSGTR